MISDAFQRQGVANLELHISDGDREHTPCSQIDVAFAANTPAETARAFFIDVSDINNHNIVSKYKCFLHFLTLFFLHFSKVPKNRIS